MEKIDALKLAESLDAVSVISSKRMRDTMLAGSQLISDVCKGKKVSEDERCEVLDGLKESFRYTSNAKAGYLIDLAIDVIEMSERESIENWRFPEKASKRKVA